MGDEKNEKDFDLSVSSLDEPDLKTKELTPDIKKRRRIILWIAGVCGVIVVIALVVVVAVIALKNESSGDDSETQGLGGQQGIAGVTSQTHEWSQWGDCNVPCGMGRRIRVRNFCPSSNTPNTAVCDKEQSRTCRYPPCQS